MKSRYCYSPMVTKKIGYRPTLKERIRRRFRKREEPDMFPICGYNAPVWVRK